MTAALLSIPQVALFFILFHFLSHQKQTKNWSADLISVGERVQGVKLEEKKKENGGGGSWFLLGK